MKEINDISLPRMNNGAHFTFVSNILARVESDSAVKSKAADQVSNFKTAVSTEDEVLKVSQKSLLTDDIAKADNDRDACVLDERCELFDELRTLGNRVVHFPVACNNRSSCHLKITP